MAQQRVTCSACGNQEAAGVRFCGRCGAPMDGSGAPLGRTPRANNQTAGGARPPGAGGGFTSNPTAIAAVLGVVAVVIIVAALLLSGGGDKKKDDPNARGPGGGGAGGNLPTLTAQSTIPAPTPQVVPTLAPQPTP